MSPSEDEENPPAVMLASHPFRNRFGYWLDRIAGGEDVILTRHGSPQIRMSAVIPRLLGPEGSV